MALELKDSLTILDYFTFIIRLVGHHREVTDHKEHSSMERQENHNYPMGMTCKSQGPMMVTVHARILI
jgi:hypothetical protein